LKEEEAVAMRFALFLLLAFLSGVAETFAQQLKSPALDEAPTLPSVEQHGWLLPLTNPRPAFLRSLTIESFGYSLKTPGSRSEYPWLLTPGPFTSHGLACPFCIMRSAMSRNKPTLPPFGAKATLASPGGRAQLFAEFGGIDYWKPDNTLLEAGLAGKRTSYHDEWLTQEILGGKFALDSGRHIWLGAAGNVLQKFDGLGQRHYANPDFGPSQPSHWNLWHGSLGFRFGH
jgi:hypothetical protein